jgi:hypothetical protein
MAQDSSFSGSWHDITPRQKGAYKYSSYAKAPPQGEDNLYSLLKPDEKEVV